MRAFLSGVIKGSICGWFTNQYPKTPRRAMAATTQRNI
jgi:hypothetical protein